MDTTDLKALKQHARFTWGRIIKIEEIGPYAIASYHPRKVNGCTWGNMEVRTVTQAINEKEIQFHTWVDGEDCSESFHSLEAALAGCIAYKTEGRNHHADRYFIQSMTHGM